MSLPQEDFANRAFAALDTAFPKLGELHEDERAKFWQILSGSWMAFDAVRTSRDRTITGSPSRANHMPPFVDEVEAYLKEIEYPIDAQHFIDFYQTRGWKISKGVPMKDWKSALRNWKREGWGHAPNKPKEAPQRQQFASLGALQIQLEKVRQDIANIVRPGGSAHPRLASSISPEEMARYNGLVSQRDALIKRIGEFTS